MSVHNKSKMSLVGGGIASLSTAVYLIRDGKVHGENITIFEEGSKIGGSLDAQNLSEGEGYIMRGIRMFEEEAYNCLFDLMSEIPSLTSLGKTLRQEFIDFNKTNKTHSKARLLMDGHAVDSRPLRLNKVDRFNLFSLLLCRESFLEGKRIDEYFSASFSKSNFWYEFCTVFSFKPEHSLIEFRRYFYRFIQSFPNIDTLDTIESSPYNQYEFLVLPIIDWLQKHHVNFVLNTKVTEIDFEKDEGGGGANFGKARKAVRLYYNQSGNQSGEYRVIDFDKHDKVFITLGSIVANSTTGSMSEAPNKQIGEKDASWALWESIALRNPESDFGRPEVFNSHIDKSKWTSFTVTFRDPTFFNLIRKFVNEKVNTYGGVNLIESNWLISIVLSYKPYFLNQPAGINLCWGYGLYPDRVGNFIKKKMIDCTGEEILKELLYHLGFEKDSEIILKTSICIPTYMPYITSLFLPRSNSDRPKVIPRGAKNFAFLGQFTEIPHDVVFTVEHSVRSAQIAVYSLLKINKKVAPIYNGVKHISILLRALRTILR